MFKKVDYLYEDNPKLPETLFAFLWYFVRQMKGQFCLILLLFGFANLFIAIQPYFFKLFIQVFEQTSDKTQIWTTIQPVLFWYVLLVLVLQPITAQLGNWVQSKTIPVWVNMMRRQLARYMHKHSYAYFQDDFAGRLAGKVTETPMAASMVVSTFMGALWYGIITFITSLVLFGSVHWIFTVTIIVFLISVFALLFYYIPKIRKKSKTASDHRSIVRGRFVDAITNILTIKLFARARHEDHYFLEALEDTSDKYVDLKLTSLRMWVWLEILSTAFFAAVVLSIVFVWQQDGLTISDIALIFPLALQVVHTIWWTAEISTELFQGLGEIQEGIEKITKGHDILDKDDASELKVQNGLIRFSNVDFYYGKDLIFENLSLEINAGEKIGIIGPSGAGKSTLIQILLRMYDIQGGEISIDNQNIANVTQESLRSHIAAIPQASDLLHRSIRDNIGYGMLDAKDDQIIAAAKKANAHDFILDLKDRDGNTGYDTLVGERGVKLSGGQRQRVAIARAILKDAPILILDEATSALDSESERLIQDSLSDLMQGKTVIAIAHRLSTIAHLDRLIVMQNGKIIEDGKHNDLLKKDGLYARLWSMQSGGFLGDDQIE